MDKLLHIPVKIPMKPFGRLSSYLTKNLLPIVVLLLSGLSVLYFWTYLNNGLGLSYNDARSHLDIGRRVVEGLKPGLAQLGSVWLPLNHLLMVPFIWNDWMWHSGLAGAIQGMAGFVGTGAIIYLYLQTLKVGRIGRLVGVAVFAANVNILYLQSTAMTEILLLATMTAGCYWLLLWHSRDRVLDLIKSAFFIMLATLVRYDGWFLAGFASMIVGLQAWIRHGFRRIEGTSILFLTLGLVGIVGWFMWNQLVFSDALYFILGPFSAHAQQLQMEAAGALPTKHNLTLSVQVYLYSLLYNTYTFPFIVALIGFFLMVRDRSLDGGTKRATVALWSPFIFNVLALYLGFSVIYVQGISGDTWFNIRYGIMLMPAIAIGIGYLVDRARDFRATIIGLMIFVLFFAFANNDAVTIDDARVGSSQKNVSEVSDFLNTHAKNEKGFILISAASHDAIIFSSGLPMKRFIHEGTGLYWENALAVPDRWARWIVVRSYDDNDLVWKGVSKSEGFARFQKVASYPFADVYEIEASLSGQLNTEPVLGKQK